MTKDLSPVDKIKKSALDAMTKETRKVALAMADRSRRRNSNEVLFYYDCGEMIRQVYMRPDVYGQNGAKQIAEYLGIVGGERYLRELRFFAESYKREDVTAQLETPMNNGRPIEMTHLLLLKRVPAGTKRNAWFKRVRQDNLTTRQLADELNSEVPAGGTGGVSGRPPEVPKSTVGALQKTSSLFQKACNWLTVFEDQVCPRLVDEEASDPMVAALERSRALVQETIDRARTVLSKLDELAEKIEEPGAGEGAAIEVPPMRVVGDDWDDDPVDPEVDDFGAAGDGAGDAEADEEDDDEDAEDDGGFGRAAASPASPARPSRPARPARPSRPSQPARPAGAARGRR